MRFAQLTAPRDRWYYCPSPGWLEQFGEYCRSKPFAYKPESNDCDDAAIEGCQLATECLLAAAPKAEASHTVLECHVQLCMDTNLNGIDASEAGHATNIVRCSDGEFYFFERMNGKFCHAKTAISNGVIGALNFVRV